MPLGFHYAVVLPYLGGLLLAAGLAAMARRSALGERLVYYGMLALVAGWFIYMIPFVTLDYRLAEVARNANDDLPLAIRIATSWSGGGSSLYLYATMVAAAVLYVARAGMATRGFLAASASVALLVLASAALNGAFDVYEGVGGFGLNPLLKSLWIIPHPLTTFGGYALLLAGSLALLYTRDRLRGMAVFMTGWGLLSFGIMFGAMWSYETIGWGGYWAWDPVEISELTVWLAATAALHALGPLAPLRRALLYVTVSSGLLAPFVTRSGLSPLHSFAAADIGSAVLLAGALAALALAAREVYRLSIPRDPLASLRRLDLPSLSIAVAGTAIIAMALFVYASLLAPSLLVALGKPATVPSMAEGVRFYHPVLYPLFILSLAWLPGYFAREMGERGFTAYLATTLAAAAAAAAAVARGVHVPQPRAPPTTNYMVAVGLAVTIMAASALTVSLALPLARRLLRRRPPRARAPLHARLRDPLLKALHIAMAVAFVGVLLSGTYAFNDYYFEDTMASTRAPGQASGVTVKVLGYQYTPHHGSIDLAGHMTGPKLTTVRAWQGLQLLKSDLARAVTEALEARRQLSENETIRALHDLALRGTLAENATLSISGRATVTLRDARTGDETVLAENTTVTVALTGANVSIQLTPATGQHGELLGAWLDYTITAGNATITIEGLKAAKLRLDFHRYLLINYTEPPTLAPAGSPTVSIRTLGLYTAGNATVKAENATFTLPNVIAGVVNGTISVGGAEAPLPYPAWRGLALLLMAERGDAPVLADVLNSSLARVLSDNATLAMMAGPEPGDINLPREAPSGLTLTVTLEVEYPGGSTVKVERIRFEANGEAAGIHGLVTPALIVRSGLSDYYLNINPPYVRGYFDAYHETLVYYARMVIDTLPPEQALPVLALMAAGYKVAELGAGVDATTAALTVEQALVDLYLLAEKFDPASSTLNTQGMLVRVKYVPAVGLVWAGTAAMAAVGLALAALYALAARAPPRAPAAEAAPEPQPRPAPLPAPAARASPRPGEEGPGGPA